MFGVLSPFALRRGHGVSAAEGGNAHAFRGRNLASSGAPLEAEGLPSSDGKAEGALIACGGRPPERRNRLPSADGKEKKDLC